MMLPTTAVALGAVLLLAGCVRSPTLVPLVDPDPLEQGRAYTTWFYEGKLDALWERLSPPLQQLFGSRRGLAGFRDQVRREAGGERHVRDERLIPWLGATLYSRTADFERAPGPVLVEWGLGADGRAESFMVTLAPVPASSPHEDRATLTPLRLPFDGEWFVFWGGRSGAENYHVDAPDQRFAYDLVVARDGSTFAGDPLRNESYHCFGRAILAPGPGTVAVAVDGVPDNVPGTMDPARPPGNHVVIDHGNGEFSFLAHLRRGSVAVARGDEVRAGERLGECGNSGNSSEPHLHYHLQDAAGFGAGTGLPAQFRDYLADGRMVARGEPARGQRIAPAP